MIALYVEIGLHNPPAAELYFDRIERRVQMLLQQPRMGARRPDIRPSTRMLVEWPYLVFYETDPDTDTGAIDRIEVVRIVHGRRDLRVLF